MTKIVLDKVQVASFGRLPSFVRDNADLEVCEDAVLDAICYQLRSYLLGNRIAQYDVVYEQPKNWWQHLKMQLGLRHVSRQYAHRITRYRTYPNAEIAVPQLGSPVTFEMMEEVPVAAAHEQ